MLFITTSFYNLRAELNFNGVNPIVFFSVLAVVLVILFVLCFCFLGPLIQKKINAKRLNIDKDKSSAKKSLQMPAIFDTKEKTVCIFANDNYEEIAVQFTLLDKELKTIKEFIVKELNFSKNEQRIILRFKDFDAYKIKYKIIDYK